MLCKEKRYATRTGAAVVAACGASCSCMLLSCSLLPGAHKLSTCRPFRAASSGCGAHRQALRHVQARWRWSGGPDPHPGEAGTALLAPGLAHSSLRRCLQANYDAFEEDKDWDTHPGRAPSHESACWAEHLCCLLTSCGVQATSQPWQRSLARAGAQSPTQTMTVRPCSLQLFPPSLLLPAWPGA